MRHRLLQGLSTLLHSVIPTLDAVLTDKDKGFSLFTSIDLLEIWERGFVIHANMSKNTGSLNMREVLIHSSCNRGELRVQITILLLLKGLQTAQKIISPINIVSLLLVNANELETRMDFSAIEEAQVSLIDETAINHKEAHEYLIGETAVKWASDLHIKNLNMKLSISYQMVIFAPKKNISDGDKFTHESDVSDIKENQFST